MALHLNHNHSSPRPEAQRELSSATDDSLTGMDYMQILCLLNPDKDDKITCIATAKSKKNRRCQMPISKENRAKALIFVSVLSDTYPCGRKCQAILAEIAHLCVCTNLKNRHQDQITNLVRGWRDEIAERSRDLPIAFKTLDSEDSETCSEPEESAEDSDSDYFTACESDSEEEIFSPTVSVQPTRTTKKTNHLHQGNPRANRQFQAYRQAWEDLRDSVTSSTILSIPWPTKTRSQPLRTEKNRIEDFYRDCALAGKTKEESSKILVQELKLWHDDNFAGLFSVPFEKLDKTARDSVHDIFTVAKQLLDEVRARR